MSQKLPVNKFEQIEDTSQFNEDFMKNYNKETNEGHLLEGHVQYLEKLHEFHNGLSFLYEKMKTEKNKKLVANLHNKTECCYKLNKFKTGIKSWSSFEKIAQNY